MVEGGFQRDLGIMQAVGIKLNLGAIGASAEEVYGSAFTNHIDSQLPGFRATYRFDDNVAAALVGRECPHSFHRVFYIRNLHHVVSAHALAGGYLRIPLNDRHDVAADRFGDLDEHQANWTSADYSNGIADLNACFVQTPQHTSQ